MRKDSSHRFSRRALSAFALAVACAAGEAGAQQPCPGGTGGPITVTNLARRDAVTYELLMVQGNLSPEAAAVRVASGGTGMDWPTARGAFKALVRLRPGENRIVLSAPGHADVCLDVTYAPEKDGNQIVLMPILPQDQAETEGVFRAPQGMPSGLEAALERYRFGALLAQTALAELMYRSGRGRRTFSLKRDSDGRVETRVYRSARTYADLKSLIDNSASDILAKGALGPTPEKRLAGIGFFQPDSVLGTLRAELPIMHFSSLYTWPRDVGDVVRAFTDPSRKTGNGTGSGPTDTLPLWWHCSYEIGYMLLAHGWRSGVPQNTSSTDLMGYGFRHVRQLFLSGIEGKPLQKDSITMGDTTAGNFAVSQWTRGAAALPVGVSRSSREPPVRIRISGGTLVFPGHERNVRVTLIAPSGRRDKILFAGSLPEGSRELALPLARRMPGNLLLVETGSGRALLPWLR